MPRHDSIAEQLKTLLEYRSRPDLDAPIEPIASNWIVVPSNDNAAPEELAEMDIDRQREFIPSVAEIMREVKSGEIVRNAMGQLTAIGKLQFSDGAQTERAYTNGPEGKLIQYDAAMPVGSMLHTRERLARERGPSQNVHIGNNVLSEMFGVGPVRHIPGKRNKRRGKSYTADESRAMLATALANTKRMPRTKKYATALPAGAANATDSFVGMKKGKKGESGAIAWQDISSMISEREMWDETERLLSADDKDTLDYSMAAKTMRDIGALHGFVGKRAERMGKQILKAANDNLAEAKKIAA